MRDGIGMKAGFVQLFCKGQFLGFCVAGKQNLREILKVNLSAPIFPAIFPALQHLARLPKVGMYYGDQVYCERWIISSVEFRLDYAEIP